MEEIATIIVLVVFPVIAITMQSHASSLLFNSPPFDYAAGKLRVAVANWRFTTELVSSPARWFHSTEEWRMARAKVFREEHPLPRLDGSVDIIPSRQAELIANNFEYRPRFTVQEFTAYTSALIQADRDYFNGPNASRYILFRPRSIDRRHPALAEGPLWPDFIRLYESNGLIDDLLLLRRRAVPRTSPLSNAEVVIGKANEDFPLRSGSVFIKVDLRKTILGHIFNAAYKLPRVRVQVTYRDGSISLHRIIPGIAREGFLISPLVVTAKQFASLLDEEPPEPDRQAASVRFISDTAFYAEDIRIETFLLNIKK